MYSAQQNSPDCVLLGAIIAQPVSRLFPFERHSDITSEGSHEPRGPGKLSQLFFTRTSAAVRCEPSDMATRVSNERLPGVFMISGRLSHTGRVCGHADLAARGLTILATRSAPGTGERGNFFDDVTRCYME